MATTRKPRTKKENPFPVTSTNLADRKTKKAIVVDDNVISFDKFQAIDPGYKRRKIYIEDMGGFIYAKPVPANVFQELSLVENIEGLPQIVSIIARYFFENLSSDEEGLNPIAPYESWMKLSPAGIITINKKIQKALGNQGEEKNG
jgi:hypothetical protein